MTTKQILGHESAETGLVLLFDFGGYHVAGLPAGVEWEPAMGRRRQYDDLRLTFGRRLEAPSVRATNYAAIYPLLYTSFWFQQRLLGESTTGYHLVNILRHVGCVLLVPYEGPDSVATHNDSDQ